MFPLKGGEMFVLWLTEEEMSLKHVARVSTKINFPEESTNIQMLTFRNKYYSKMALCWHPSRLAQSTGTRAAPIWRQTWPVDLSLSCCFPLCTALFVPGFPLSAGSWQFKESSNCYFSDRGRNKGAPCLLFAQFSPFKWNDEIGWISASEGQELLWRSEAVLTCLCEPPPAPLSLLVLQGSWHSWLLHVGKQHSSGCRQEGLRFPLSLQQQFLAFPAGCLLLQGKDRADSQTISQESFPVSAWRSKEGFVAAWGWWGSWAVVTSGLAEIQIREMCLFSHLRLESSRPVEKGQVHIQHSSGRGKIHFRSTWERGKFCSWEVPGNFTKFPCSILPKIFMRHVEIK